MHVLQFYGSGLASRAALAQVLLNGESAAEYRYYKEGIYELYLNPKGM